MNPASPSCDRFFEALAKLDLPLISHAGEERAVHGGNTQHFGNPLLLRRALDHGVRVVVAHCGAMGQDRDLDKGENGPYVDSSDLFARLMDDPVYGPKLSGDISAMTQLNRAGPALETVLAREDWHPRLHNGSDYPLPGVMPLFSVAYMAQLGLIPPSAVPVLGEIRRHNPLLFDFVLKRHLSFKGKRFAPSVFMTRSCFVKKEKKRICSTGFGCTPPSRLPRRTVRRTLRALRAMPRPPPRARSAWSSPGPPRRWRPARC